MTLGSETGNKGVVPRNVFELEMAIRIQNQIKPLRIRIVNFDEFLFNCLAIL